MSQEIKLFHATANAGIYKRLVEAGHLDLMPAFKAVENRPELIEMLRPLLNKVDLNGASICVTNHKDLMIVAPNKVDTIASISGHPTTTTVVDGEPVVFIDLGHVVSENMLRMEGIHVEQMMRNDLVMGEEVIIWKGQEFPVIDFSQFTDPDEVFDNLLKQPWEVEAIARSYKAEEIEELKLTNPKGYNNVQRCIDAYRGSLS